MGTSIRGVAAAVILGAGVAGAALAFPRVQDGNQPDRPRQPGQPGQPGGPGRPGGPGGPGGDRQPSVGGSMRAVNRGFRELEANIANPAMKDQNLQAVWMMQRGVVNAKASRLPEDLRVADPEKTLDSIRRRLITLLGTLLELETAILDGKTDQAKALLAKVKEMKDKNHEELGVHEEEEEGEGAGGAGGGAPGGGASGGGR